MIPQQLAESVVAQTEAVAKTENPVRDAIPSSLDPVEAHLEHGKF